MQQPSNFMSEHVIYYSGDKLFGFGCNSSFQIPNENNSTESILKPTLLMDDDSIKLISCGESQSLILKRNGDLYGCGDNDRWQLGLGDANITKWSLIVNDITIKKVLCGEEFTIYLTSDGRIMGCGSNIYGQLGIENTHSLKTPTLIMKNTKIKDIFVGFAHTFVLMDDGDLFGFGGNGFGQLSLDPSIRKTFSPKLIMKDKNIINICCGYNHTIILKKGGRVYSFGQNTDGQCGVESEEFKIYTPKLVVTDPEIKNIYCGAWHSMYYTNKGDLYIWGRNFPGEKIRTPILLLNDPDISKICCSKDFTLLLKNNGEVLGFGNNKQGQVNFNFGYFVGKWDNRSNFQTYIFV
eukprot:TRINITY_DN2200_c0_g1_i1.p1 TRINITY_DN2200_c0_g1~~TRINITY_DN2200_c0_g1_i1.p1  ORF type:complete len:351 (+),score=58.48 TRINITY_DN2200_c0_g1_i1:68-1120(+)